MASASTPSANEPAKYLILVHTVQLNPMIKAQISVRMVSSGTFASVFSDKTLLKKLMMMKKMMMMMMIIINKSRETMVLAGVRN